MTGIFLARPDSPAEGIPLAVKDLFDTAGLTTTYGSAIFGDHVPAGTATAVTMLEAAGYANVGKTNLHEFAYGITSVNPHYGTVPNPRYPGRMAGGSSGGSAAAVAAGLAVVGLGSDSGGSIRIPAACCGLVGFKPTYCLMPMDGCFPLAPSFDHAGVIAATVADCAAAMAPFGVRPDDVPVSQLVFDYAWLDGADRLVCDRVAYVAASLGAGPADLPYPQVGAVFMHEVAEVHRELFAEHAAEYGDNVRTKIERCLALPSDAYQRGLAARAEYRERCDEVIAAVDLLITPTLGFVAPPVPADDLALREGVIQRTLPLNALGWPALALPCGPAEDGLPASVQIIGKPGADALVLGAGAQIESLLLAKGITSRDADP